MLREQHQAYTSTYPTHTSPKMQRTMYTFVYSPTPICLIRYFVYTLHFRS